MEDEQSLLKWLEKQTTTDEIEDITDEMLDLIIEKMPYVAVLFCKFNLFALGTLSIDYNFQCYFRRQGSEEINKNLS